MGQNGVRSRRRGKVGEYAADGWMWTSALRGTQEKTLKEHCTQGVKLIQNQLGKKITVKSAPKPPLPPKSKQKSK